jgi:DEAD/DEAH box helicase domain-containing protein
LERLVKKQNIVLATSTSSGKSLVYQLYMIHLLLQDPAACVLLVFPTKALSQDQMQRCNKILEDFGISQRVQTFDGDTPCISRSQLIDSCQLIITNPDMIHSNILPNHEKWKHFFKRLRFMFVDEVHYYHSEFGAHVSNVFHRLLRMYSYYEKNTVQLMACSATIPNPVNFVTRLFGVDGFQCVDQDGSPMHPKTLIIWTTPIPCSILDDVPKLVHLLLSQQLRTIIFLKTRKQCELFYKEIKEYKAIVDDKLDDVITSYRGGYSVQERRSIEQKLFEKKVMVVVCTNALELGIDISSLDCCIHVGFPGTMSSYRQQSGRAGRNGESIDILIADQANQADFYYSENPRELFLGKSCNIDIEERDESIIKLHINCAAFELPIGLNDPYYCNPEKRQSVMNTSDMIWQNLGIYHQ